MVTVGIYFNEYGVLYMYEMAFIAPDDGLLVLGEWIFSLILMGNLLCFIL